VRNDGDFGRCLEQVLSLVINRMATWCEPIVGELLDFQQRELHSHLRSA
jgi:hypothetical protein